MHGSPMDWMLALSKSIPPLPYNHALLSYGLDACSIQVYHLLYLITMHGSPMDWMLALSKSIPPLPNNHAWLSYGLDTCSIQVYPSFTL